jgi:hypothetical protein
MANWKESTWRVVKFCVNCDTELSDHTIICSDAVCPSCGAKSKGPWIKVYERTLKYKWKDPR